MVVETTGPTFAQFAVTLFAGVGKLIMLFGTVVLFNVSICNEF